MLKTTLIIIAIVAAAFLLLVFYAKRKFKNLPEVDANANILQLTEQNFNHQIKNRLVLVDFWATWCAPCKMMLPILNDVTEAADGKFFVAKVDVDQNPKLAQKYGVRSIPTLVAFKDGKEVGRYVGVKTKNFLLGEMKKF